MGKILNDEMAKKAIEKICEYLEEASLKKKKGLTIEKESADLARELCHELLNASMADGIGGCTLCRG